jgi:hypothetical protein
MKLKNQRPGPKGAVEPVKKKKLNKPLLVNVVTDMKQNLVIRFLNILIFNFLTDFHHV